MIRFAVIAAVMSVFSAPAHASFCPGNPNALGTERVLEVDAKTTPRIGRKHFPASLSLESKELVLTFDDGPWPGTTSTVLEALKHECVRATFFMLGRHSKQYPALARRVFAEGHTVGHHTYSHLILSRISIANAENDINRGIEQDDYAVYGQRRSVPAVPFFRFPGFVSTPALLDLMSRRGMVVFGADAWASDWLPMSRSEQLKLILGRVEAIGSGIVLLHDTKVQTAHMLPEFLRELKRRGFRIVHVVPAGHRDAIH